MDKKEEVRQWIDDLIFKLQQKSFTGSVTLNFYQGGVTDLNAVEIYEKFKSLEKVSILS